MCRAFCTSVQCKNEVYRSTSPDNPNRVYRRILRSYLCITYQSFLLWWYYHCFAMIYCTECHYQGIAFCEQCIQSQSVNASPLSYWVHFPFGSSKAFINLLYIRANKRTCPPEWLCFLPCPALSGQTPLLVPSRSQRPGCAWGTVMETALGCVLLSPSHSEQGIISTFS